MVKKTNRKGFTLIEILIVIAIIAALVSVVIPIVQRETLKARAAANAASLRSIEGQVAMHMVLNEGAYDTYMKNSDTISAASTGVLGKVYNFFFGAGAAENFAAKYERLHDNGRGEIPVPGGDTIPNAAEAQPMEAPNRNGEIVMTIQKGQRMSVYITEEGAIAFYGDWNKYDFADVAEDGIYDGTTTSTGGSTGGAGGIQGWIENEACIAAKSHTPGPGCICQTCGGEAHWGADAPRYEESSTSHICEEGHILNDEHIYVEVDKTYHKCVRCGDAAQNLEHTWNNRKCTACDADKPQCEATGCYEVVVDGTSYCVDHQLKACGATLNDGSSCTEQIPAGTTCPNALNHAVINTCLYPGCGKTVISLFGSSQLCSTHKNYVSCSAGHWYDSSTINYCKICDPTYNCAFKNSSGVQCTNTVKVNGGFCSTHGEKNCPKNVMNWLNTGLTGCDGTYRDPSIGKCGATHYKEVTKTCNVGSGKYIASYCSNCGNWHKSGTTKTYTAYEVDNS